MKYYTSSEYDPSQKEAILRETQQERARDTADFEQGKAFGFHVFEKVYQHPILTDQQTRDMLISMMNDTTNSSMWNAGYVIGWTKAYHQQKHIEPPVPPHLYAELSRQLYVAHLLTFIVEGTLTLREAADEVDNSMNDTRAAKHVAIHAQHNPLQACQ